MLGTCRPGRYLLTHAPGSDRICLFAALPDDPATQQVRAALWLHNRVVCAGEVLIASLFGTFVAPVSAPGVLPQRWL